MANAAPAGGPAGAAPGGDHALWHPSPERVSRSALLRFARQVQVSEGVACVDGARLDYDALHRWSVEHPERFWAAVWRLGGIEAEGADARQPWASVLVGGE
ncbi:MAG TPA: hypothetical protein VFV33_04165, partial [Gemmatimonadaceae bacterium]|nr:hypothetical protein [Gemmatimonadaceae bacterium]